MPGPRQEDWDSLVEVLDPVAKDVDENYVDEQVKDEGNPENPAEEESSNTDSSEEDKPPEPDLSKYVSKDRVEELIRERLEREKESAQKKQAEAERKAAREALAKNQEFEELAKTQAEELEALRAQLSEKEELETSLSTYRERVGNSVRGRVEKLNLPQGVAKLLENMDPAEQQDWLDENEGDFSHSTQRVPEGETPTEDGLPPEVDEEARLQEQNYAFNDF